MKKKIALIGANGQLATDIVKVFSKEDRSNLFPLTHADIEITDSESIKDALNAIAPDIVLNTAAYNRVDDGEKEPEKAFAINSIGPKLLATYCNEKNIIFAHVSTDYVFGGDKDRNTPYVESDPPAPINTYGISKLAGELFIKYICKKYFIIRSTGLFGTAGSSGKGVNFVELMIKLAFEKKPIRVVTDQIVSPTYTVDLAKQILRLLETEQFGLYHATAQGQCSWYEFSQEIFLQTGIKAKVKGVSSSQFPTQARRPNFSVLENKKLKGINLDTMIPWKTGLINYLAEKSIGFKILF